MGILYAPLAAGGWGIDAQEGTSFRCGSGLNPVERSQSPQVRWALSSTYRYGAEGLTGGLLWPPPAARAAATAAIPAPPAIATMMRVEWVRPAEADGSSGNGSGLEGALGVGVGFAFGFGVGVGVGAGRPDAFAGINLSSPDPKRYDCCD